MPGCPLRTSGAITGRCSLCCPTSWLSDEARTRPRPLTSSTASGAPLDRGKNPAKPSREKSTAPTRTRSSPTGRRAATLEGRPGPRGGARPEEIAPHGHHREAGEVRIPSGVAPLPPPSSRRREPLRHLPQGRLVECEGGSHLVGDDLRELQAVAEDGRGALPDRPGRTVPEGGEDHGHRRGDAQG